MHADMGQPGSEGVPRLLAGFACLLAVLLGFFAGHLLQAPKAKEAQARARKAQEDARGLQAALANAQQQAQAAQAAGLGKEAQLRRLAEELQWKRDEAESLAAELELARQELAQAQPKPAPSPTPADPLDELSKGMSPDDVAELLGDPASRLAAGTEERAVEAWTYDDGTQVRFVDGALEEWQRS